MRNNIDNENDAQQQEEKLNWKADNVNSSQQPTVNTMCASDSLTIDIEEASSTWCNSPNNNDKPAILHPPPSKLELLRDQCLEILGGKAHNWIALIVLILIVIDGAFFFFLLIGAHNMCDTPSRTNCDPRNYWYNFSIQVLNVLFTYLAIVSMPWKIAHAEHLLGTKRRRSHDAGLDLYGQPTKEIWYHIHPQRRRGIVALLIINSLTQYANQVTRIVYYNYELQSTYPGILWTNLFFVASFACAAIAGIWQVYEETLLRRHRTYEFPPGLVEICTKYVRAVICGSSTKQEQQQQQGELATQSTSVTMQQQEDTSKDTEGDLPTKEEGERRKCLSRVREWLQSDKTSLDLWGL